MADAKQGKPPMEDYCNGSSQSRVVLAKPRLGGFGSSSLASSSNKSCNPFGSVLRPAQLKPNTNPFLKVTENLESENDKDKVKDKKDAETPTKDNEDRLKETKEEPEAPKFIPLGSSNVTPRTNNPVNAPVQPTSSSAGFVFGQNLSERVVLNDKVNNGEAPSVDHSSTNGATELLFTSAVASVKENNQPEEPGASEPSSSGESASSLAAAAAEYERSHARPPPPTTNFTTTGEEGETNVLQISCRLFAWEAGSWRERGRGVLRLNECVGGARLVARMAGSLRVVLNTKLWPAMVVERAGTKSLRVTASDAAQQVKLFLIMVSGTRHTLWPAMVVERAGTKSLRVTAADAAQQVKLFLIMGAPGDINQLYRALTTSITVAKRTNDCAQNSTSQQAAERLEAAADESEYLDKANDDLYGRDDDDDKQDMPLEDNAKNDRIVADDEKTEETNVDDSNEENETKSLKRKEPAENETPPKRQCPKILIE